MSVLLFYYGKQQFLFSVLDLCGIVHDISSCHTLVGYVLKLLLCQSDLFDPSYNSKNSTTKRLTIEKNRRRLDDTVDVTKWIKLFV